MKMNFCVPNKKQYWRSTKMLSLYLSMIEDPVDKLQFEDLFEKYNLEIMRYAMALTRNHQDAEDICQNVWMKIANHFDTIKVKDDEKIKAYIVKTTKNEAFDFFNKNKKRRFMSDENLENLEINSNSFDSVLMAVCQRETVDTIYNCINSLDEKYRDVLDFYYINQSSPKDIAEFLNIDVRTARKRIERGRAMLINMLIKKGEGNGNQI